MNREFSAAAFSAHHSSFGVRDFLHRLDDQQP